MSEPATAAAIGASALHVHESEEVYVGGRNGKEHVWQCPCGATGIVAPWSDWLPSAEPEVGR